MPSFVTFEVDRMRSGMAMVHGMNQGMISITPGNMRFSIESPRENRRANPLTFTVVFDPAIYHFFNSLGSNKVFPRFVLDFWRPDPKGSGNNEVFYKIILTDAVITSLKRKFGPNAPEAPSQYRTNGFLDIQLIFQRITWVCGGGGTKAADAWTGHH
jgi:type VI secretion system Hcp family effector